MTYPNCFPPSEWEPSYRLAEDVALDSITYTGADTVALRSLNRYFVYHGVIADTIWESTTVLEDFVDTMKLSPWAVMDSVMSRMYWPMPRTVTDSLKDMVTSIVAQDTAQMALQAALSVMTSAFLATDSVYDEPSLEGLRELASRCPYVDGNGVYMARTMLSRLDTVTWFISHPCEFVPMPPSARLSEPEHEEEPSGSVAADGFMLYPNPSAGEFTVRFPEQEGSMTVQVTDLSGRICSVTKVQGNSGRALLSPGLGIGTYLLTLYDMEGTRLWTARFILIPVE